MYINAKVHYAVAIMRAVTSSDKPVTLDEICFKYNLSQDFMYQIAKNLRKANWLHSKRGPGGGYSAIKKTGSIYEVSQVMAGRLRKTEDINGISESVSQALSQVRVF